MFDNKQITLRPSFIANAIWAPVLPHMHASYQVPLLEGLSVRNEITTWELLGGLSFDSPLKRHAPTPIEFHSPLSTRVILAHKRIQRQNWPYFQNSKLRWRVELKVG